MKDLNDFVSIAIDYNAGCYDLLTGLRIWENDTEVGKFLYKHGTLSTLDGNRIDENYMSVAYATYKLSKEDRAAYKFMFESNLC